MDWWEPVAQILGACIGICAAFAAFQSWKTARELNRIETERDAKQARAAERYQAEHVAVVGVHCPDTPEGEQYAIMVVNGSDAPIYDIRVESQKANKSRDNPVLELAVLPPGKFVIPAHPKFHWGSVIDQEVAQMKLNMMAKGNAGEMITHVSFADAASRKWELVRGRELRRAASGGGAGH